MQRKNTVWTWIADRGYYIALGICVLAVGVSGWLFVRSLRPVGTDLEETGAQTVLLPTLAEDRIGQRPGAAEELPAAVITPLPARPDPVGTEPEQTEPPETEAAALPPQPVVLEIVSPLEGTVSQPYSMDRLSYNPTTRDWRTHAGLDIAAPAGPPVSAAAEGVGQAVYEDDLLGWTVTVRHAGGWVTHYANLAETPAVEAGDYLEAGQRLGAVGNTALLEVGGEPHLHFAVYKNNVAQDPAAFLEP